jgi:hypothetical protein
MLDPSDDIDEVALNVLLADGVDLPTAWEASQRGTGTDAVPTPGRGWVIVNLLVILGLAF